MNKRNTRQISELCQMFRPRELYQDKLTVCLSICALTLCSSLQIFYALLLLFSSSSSSSFFTSCILSNFVHNLIALSPFRIREQFLFYNLTTLLLLCFDFMLSHFNSIFSHLLIKYFSFRNYSVNSK